MASKKHEKSFALCTFTNARFVSVDLFLLLVNNYQYAEDFTEKIFHLLPVNILKIILFAQNESNFIEILDVF